MMTDNSADHDNDNEPDRYVEPPAWAWEIVDKYDLALRAPDGPLEATTVLLTDAAFDVREIAATAFREQALTQSTKQRLRDVIAMLTDAERLSAVCEDEPSFGVVTVLADGTQRWEEKRSD